MTCNDLKAQTSTQLPIRLERLVDSDGVNLLCNAKSNAIFAGGKHSDSIYLDNRCITPAKSEQNLGEDIAEYDKIGVSFVSKTTVFNY
jgi:hypothetical protein